VLPRLNRNVRHEEDLLYHRCLFVKNIYNLRGADSSFASDKNTGESDVALLVSFHDLSNGCIAERYFAINPA
jgi:hypothetical protein